MRKIYTTILAYTLCVLCFNAIAREAEANKNVKNPKSNSSEIEQDLSAAMLFEDDEPPLVLFTFEGEVLTPAIQPTGAITSNFQVIGTTPTFNSAQASTWSGSGVPVAQSGQGWGEDNAADAKYFFFTIDANDGFEMDISQISFQWRATGNGPSAITVEINGIEIDTFDAPADETTSFSADLADFSELTQIEVRIKGWDNDSRETPGTGILRVNDVRLDGQIVALNPVLVSSQTEIENLDYEAGSGPSDAQMFEVSGENLDETNVLVSVPSSSNFELALSSDAASFDQSITLNEFDGSLSEVFVRLKEGLALGEYSDEITISGGGANAIEVAVSGRVSNPIIALYEFTGDVLTPSIEAPGVTASDFQASEGTPGFNSGFAATWLPIGSGVPVATSNGGWGEDSTEDAKYFFFTVDANTNFEMSLSNISFEWRATGAGPSAISVEVNGEEIATFDAPADETSFFSAPLMNMDELTEVEVRVYGWDNGSRSTTGGGNFRINDVRLEGETSSLTAVLLASPTSLSGFTYIEENGPSATQSFQVSGESLDNSDVVLNLEEDAPFEMATSEEGIFMNEVVLSNFDGSATQVFVRLKEDLDVGAYQENITISGGNAESIQVSLSGEVVEDLFLIYEFTGEVATPSQSPPNATTSEFQVTGTTPTFNSLDAGWSGSGVPVIQSGSDWGATSVEDAKYFFFTIEADSGFAMDIDEISFEWRATNAGPSAITVEINGIEIETFDAINNQTTLFSASLENFENLAEIEVRIYGWDNGSRDTSGGGILRLNDVRLNGNIDTSLSIEEVNIMDDITIFPNPFKDKFTIQLPQVSLENVQIEVFDMRGRRMIQEKHSSPGNSLIINTQELNSGLYILTISSDSGNFSQKIVKP